MLAETWAGRYSACELDGERDVIITHCNCDDYLNNLGAPTCT